ncbi:MAG: hypothetical protein V1706_10285 [Pseudomonadota bacterium]
MDCKKTIAQRDNFHDGYLSDKETDAIRIHITTCQSCRQAMQHDADLLQALRDLPVPPPRPDFAARALNAARATHNRRRVKKISAYWGTALAACLAVWIMVGQPDKTVLPTPSSPSFSVTLKLHEQKTVNLVVNAPQDLMNADVTVQLPQQLVMVGFPENSEIKWTTNLRKGKNLLSLPLMAKGSGNVELVTRINHQNKSKILKVEMQIGDNNEAGTLHIFRHIC